MKCYQVQEKLLHSIDKELSPQIRAHLLGCKECERKYRILQETQKSLEDFGRAVRDGSISMETPPFPPVRRRSVWIEIRDKSENAGAGVDAICCSVRWGYCCSLCRFFHRSPRRWNGAHKKGVKMQVPVPHRSQRRGCWNFSLCPIQWTRVNLPPQLKRLKRS